MTSEMKQTLSITVVFCLAMPSTAFAYLDGGTISMALQLIAGGIGIGFLFLRRWLDTIKKFLKPQKCGEDKDNQNKNVD